MGRSTLKSGQLEPVISTEEALAWADRTVDGRGMPIDPGIIRLVAGLHRYGIETEMSCEGHRNYGPGYPWIRFSGPENYQAISVLVETLTALDGFDIYVPNPTMNTDYGLCELRPAERVSDEPLLRHQGGVLQRIKRARENRRFRN